VQIIECVNMDTFSGFKELLDESFSPGTYIIYFCCLMLSNTKITLTAKLNSLNCNFDIVECLCGFNLFTVALIELTEIIDNASIQPMEAFDDNV
jgi:hypothetical protein